jgi:hypothetical protein
MSPLRFASATCDDARKRLLTSAFEEWRGHVVSREFAASRGFSADSNSSTFAERPEA